MKLDLLMGFKYDTKKIRNNDKCGLDFSKIEKNFCISKITIKIVKMLFPHPTYSRDISYINT